MATVVMEPAEKAAEDRDRDHVRYQFTAEQALAMVEAGIIPEAIELLDGVFYVMVKGELHSSIVTQIARKLGPLIPPEFHIREEKSCRADPGSLPEPDVMVCTGGVFDYLPSPPPLAKLALVVEVTYSSDEADRVTKFGLYATAGVPCYWIVNVRARNVEVWTLPAKSEDGPAGYQSLVTFKRGLSIPVVIDGQPRGEVNVSDIFPPEKQS